MASLKLIVAGMHRSGTSLTASFVDAIGVSMGDRLLAADTNNKKGYFEDVEFLEFHRAVLTDSTRSDEPGVHDWGWTVSENLDRENFARFTDRAREIIRSRDEALPAWGWKDPRTTVMLDFWDDLLPDARYLLVYRAPWDVAESMIRVGGEYFPRNPDHSLSIWSFYNEQMLRFYRDHRDRCLLFNVNALIAEPEKLASLIQERLGITLTDEAAAGKFRELYSGDLFHAFPPEHPVVQLCRHYAPRAVSVLEELEGEADLPGNALPPDSAGVDPDRIAAWPFFCHAETLKAHREHKAREAALQAEKEEMAADYRKNYAQLQEWLRDREAELAQVRADLYHQNLAALEEKHKLQKQVTELFQLNQELSQLNKERETQTGQLLEEMRAVYAQLDQLKWENSQLSYERDHLRLTVKSMEETRIWQLREKVRRLTGSAGKGQKE